MKNTFKQYAVITVMLITALSMACSVRAVGKSINSAEALKEYLDSQPANSPDKPIKVAMNVNALMLISVVEVIESAGKYVSLDLSRSSGLTVIEVNTFMNVTTLVGITIPKSVTSIGDWAFRACESLASVTIGNGVTSIGNGAFYECTSLASVTFQGTIVSSGFGDAFHGDLRDKYLAGA